MQVSRGALCTTLALQQRWHHTDAEALFSSRLCAGLPWCSLFPCTSYPACCAEACNSSHCHFRLQSSDLLLFFPKHMCSECLPFALTHNSVNGRVNNQRDCSIAIVSLLLHSSVHPLSIVRYLIHNHKTHSQLKAFSFPKTTSKNPHTISSYKTNISSDWFCWLLPSLLALLLASHLIFNIFPWFCLLFWSSSAEQHCPAWPVCWCPGTM